MMEMEEVEVVEVEEEAEEAGGTAEEAEGPEAEGVQVVQVELERLGGSARCRLCAAHNTSGEALWSPGPERLADRLNAYLPLTVEDDGKYPRTICPGCNIQLEATITFFDLIIKGQKILREILEKERRILRKVDKEGLPESIICEFNPENGLFTPQQPISLQVAGLDKPKRKRGRPKKTPKLDEVITNDVATPEKPAEAPPAPDPEETPAGQGKRKRKAPSRFREAVQGKELERIFREEGVIDAEEVDLDSKETNDTNVSERHENISNVIIGHMHAPDGMGEPILFNKGKGRGKVRRAGNGKASKYCCVICGMKFSCSGRYMSHIAQHGPVTYQCAQCQEIFGTRLDFNQHQETSGHEGQNIIKNNDDNPSTQDVVKEIELPLNSLLSEIPNTDITDVTNASPVPAEILPIEYNGIDMVNQDNCQLSVTVDDPLALPSLENDNTEPPDSNENETLIKEDNLKKEIDIAKEDAEINEDTDLPKEKQKDEKKKASLKCPHCDKVFRNKQNKFVHIRGVHKRERPYACKDCGATFPYARSLKLHKVTHRERKEHGYACDLCGKVLNHPSSVVYHKETEHMGLKYECLKCGKLFKHKQLLQRHQISHSELRPYSCKFCPGTFKTKPNLVNHESLHTDSRRKFNCELCGQTFSQRSGYNLHLRLHSGVKPFTCEYCHKSFNQRGNLTEHMRTHTGEKPYKCGTCTRTFTTSSQCRLHAQRHTGDKPFSCTHCNKRFVSRDAWRQHMARELNLLNYWCSVCGRRFGERWALTKHQRCHTGEKPFQCTQCPRKFSDSSNLTKHKKIHKNASLLARNHLSNTQVAEEKDGEERVIYVTYNMEQDSDTVHIMAPEQAEREESDKMLLYEPQPNDQLLHNIDHTNLQTHIVHNHHQVIDEHGNPIHFTMQDGTRLAITSADGKTLQVTTEDGQTIPVELNTLSEVQEQECEEGEGSALEYAVEGEVGLQAEAVELEEETVEVLTPNGQTVRMLNFDDPTLAHFFTIA